VGSTCIGVLGSRLLFVARMGTKVHMKIEEIPAVARILSLDCMITRQANDISSTDQITAVRQFHSAVETWPQNRFDGPRTTRVPLRLAETLDRCDGKARPRRPRWPFSSSAKANPTKLRRNTELVVLYTLALALAIH
jgi:hypothetical protein